MTTRSEEAKKSPQQKKEGKAKAKEEGRTRGTKANS